MIQPQLLSYGLGMPPEPVLLDVTSIQADRILLLDSFFYVVLFHGTTIALWRKSEYHKQEEHAAFAELLAVRVFCSDNRSQRFASIYHAERIPWDVLCSA